MKVQIGRRRETLTRNQQQDLAEFREKVEHRRINRIAIGKDKTLRKLHAAEVADGSHTLKLMAYGACLRPCVNRSIKTCAACWRFDKFKPGSSTQVNQANARYQRQVQRQQQ